MNLLIAGKTEALLAQLEVRYPFLHDPSSEWLTNQDLISRQHIVRDLKVVNDSGERELYSYNSIMIQ